MYIFINIFIHMQMSDKSDVEVFLCLRFKYLYLGISFRKYVIHIYNNFLLMFHVIMKNYFYYL